MLADEAVEPKVSLSLYEKGIGILDTAGRSNNVGRCVSESLLKLVAEMSPTWPMIKSIYL